MLEVTAAIIRKDDKILICQREKDDECGLLWEFPGGKKEPGETLEYCIIREIKEELNIDIAIIDVYAKTTYQFGNKLVPFTFYNVAVTGGDFALTVHNDFRWVLPKELDLYSYMPADIEIVEKLKMDFSK